MSVSAGDSRMSSVCGLKASPHTAMRAPLMRIADDALQLREQEMLLRSFASSTACSTDICAPRSTDVRSSAFTSFGKHEPP